MEFLGRESGAEGRIESWGMKGRGECYRMRTVQRRSRKPRMRQDPSGKASVIGRPERLGSGIQRAKNGAQEGVIIRVVVRAAQGQQPDLLSPLDLHCFEHIFSLQHHEVAVMDAVVPEMRGP